MDELWAKNVENRDFTVVVPIFQNSDRNLFWNWPDSRLPKKELGRSNNSSVPSRYVAPKFQNACLKLISRAENYYLSGFFYR